MNENQDIFNTVTNKAKEFVLSEKEKTMLFRAVDLHVSQHPIEKSLPQTSRFNDIRWWSYISTHYSQAMSFALVLFVVLGTGTSYAAQRSLPGDLLYAVKIGINEQLHSFVLSDVKKTLFEADRAAERLKEAQVLAVRGELTDDLKVKIENEFDSHVAAVQQKTEEYAEKGEYSKALAVNSSLEAVLQEQEEGTQQTALSEKVQTTLQNSLAVRVKTENSIMAATTGTEDVRLVAKDRQESAAKLLAYVSEQAPTTTSPTAASLSVDSSEPVSKTSKRTAKTLKAEATADVVEDKNTEIIELVNRATQLMQYGDTAYREGRYNEAFGWYRDAQSVASQAQVLIELQDSTISPDTINEELE